jgi:hypothetical protein
MDEALLDLSWLDTSWNCRDRSLLTINSRRRVRPMHVSLLADVTPSSGLVLYISDSLKLPRPSKSGKDGSRQNSTTLSKGLPMKNEGN